MKWEEILKGQTFVAVRVSIIYLLLSALWIFFSDRILANFISDAAQLTTIQTYKGWAFVLASALLIFALLKQELKHRKRSEHALHEYQRRLSTLMDNLSGMAYRCKNDTDWTMEFVSEGCLGLTGYPPCDVIDNSKISYGSLIVPEDRDYVWHEAQKALQEGKHFQLIYRIKDATGKERWVWEQGVGVYSSQGKLIALEGFISDITEQKQAQVREKRLQHQLERTAVQTITTLAQVIDERDEYTAGHCRRLARLSVILGKKLGLPAKRLDQLRYAALLHDVGKVGVPDKILNKAGKFTKSEWIKMKEHVNIGTKLVQGIYALNRASQIIAQHHERWDGQGYPRGLSGENILLEARIIAVVDSYDAMITDRPYRKASTPKEALAEIEKASGTQFDPQIAKAFIEELSRWSTLPRNKQPQTID